MQANMGLSPCNSVDQDDARIIIDLDTGLPHAPSTPPGQVMRGPTSVDAYIPQKGLRTVSPVDDTIVRFNEDIEVYQDTDPLMSSFRKKSAWPRQVAKRNRSHYLFESLTPQSASPNSKADPRGAVEFELVKKRLYEAEQNTEQNKSMRQKPIRIAATTGPPPSNPQLLMKYGILSVEEYKRRLRNAMRHDDLTGDEVEHYQGEFVLGRDDKLFLHTANCSAKVTKLYVDYFLTNRKLRRHFASFCDYLCATYHIERANDFLRDCVAKPSVTDHRKLVAQSKSNRRATHSVLEQIFEDPLTPVMPSFPRAGPTWSGNG